MQKTLYFDHMASTKLHPDVYDVMCFYLSSERYYSNPHASHPMAQVCLNKIDELTLQMQELLSNKPGQIIWTSGATESINMAILGACRQYQYSGKHIISLLTEHSATLEALRTLEKEGFEVSLLPVKNDGLLDLDVLKSTIRPDTIMLSLTHVHNEIGVIQDIQAISNICKQHGILFHADCAQSIGKSNLPLIADVDFASFSAHKCQGPKGIGALFISDSPCKKIQKIIHGGSQQRGLRAGTVPLYLIAGFVKACQINHKHHKKKNHYEQLIACFKQDLNPNIHWNGCLTNRALQNINITLPEGINLDDLSLIKNKFSLSTQSACRSGKTSHVLHALGLTQPQQNRSLRISLGSDTTLCQVQLLKESLNGLCASS